MVGAVGNSLGSKHPEWRISSKIPQHLLIRTVPDSYPCRVRRALRRGAEQLGGGRRWGKSGGTPTRWECSYVVCRGKEVWGKGHVGDNILNKKPKENDNIKTLDHAGDQGDKPKN